MVWGDEEAQAIRREVLLRCLEQLKARAGLPWARTAAHLALQAARTHRSRFCERQHARLQELVAFLQASQASVRKVRGLPRSRSAVHAPDNERVAALSARVQLRSDACGDASCMRGELSC
jgi:hypothetical protein